MPHELETISQNLELTLALIKEVRAEVEEIHRAMDRINEYLQFLKTPGPDTPVTPERAGG